MVIEGPTPTQHELEAKIQRGAHQSAHKHKAFIRQEMAEFINSGYWVVLPFDQVKHLPNLHLSPLGVKEERERKPRLVADHSFYGENNLTVPYAPTEAMQFGSTLYQILHRIRHANPKFGPVYMSKYDLKDGFYRLHLRPDHAPALAVILPQYDGEPPMVAIPLVLTMGWVNSPPTFCSLTETVCDIANNRTYRHQAPPHRLEVAASNHDEDASPHSAPARINQGPPSDQPCATPLEYFDIFVDDFLALAQGSPHRRKVLRRILLHAIDEVLEYDGNRESVSLKKILKLEGSWRKCQIILGWLIDTLAQTLELPDHQQ